MKQVISGIMIAGATAVLIMLASGSAVAGEPIEIGGRQAMTLNFTFNHDKHSKATVITNLSLTTTTQNARWEMGAGLTYMGMGLGNDDFTVTTLIPSATARINSNLYGPEANILVYLGGNIGVAVQTIDITGFSDTTETGVSGGPKAGVEYYWSPDVALQLEYQAILQEDKIEADGGVLLTNAVLLGLKVLF